MLLITLMSAQPHFHPLHLYTVIDSMGCKYMCMTLTFCGHFMYVEYGGTGAHLSL